MVTTLMLLLPQPCLRVVRGQLLAIMITLFFEYQIVVLILWLMMGPSLFIIRLISVKYLIALKTSLVRRFKVYIYFVEPTTLAAKVSYGGNESKSDNWIVDYGSTHHTNGHHTEFFRYEIRWVC